MYKSLLINSIRCSYILMFIFIVSIFLNNFNIKINAYTFDPSTNQNFLVNGTTQIVLKASPNGTNQKAVRIRLEATNLTVNSFVPVTGGSWVGASQDCNSGGSYFTNQLICTSLANSVNIQEGEILGTISVTFNSNQASLNKLIDNGYSDGTTFIIDQSNNAIYNLNTASNNQSSLPTTALGDNNLNYFILLGIILLGIIIQRNNLITKATKSFYSLFDKQIQNNLIIENKVKSQIVLKKRLKSNREIFEKRF